jgi:hypothetical protein
MPEPDDDNIPPESDPKNLAGNHILIQCQGGDVLLAHLQRGSIIDRAGETVETEQAFSAKRNCEATAKVGNSGNTTEPHLHIHARKADTGKSILDGEGMPILFFRSFLIRNSVFFRD